MEYRKGKTEDSFGNKIFVLLHGWKVLPYKDRDGVEGAELWAIVEEVKTGECYLIDSCTLQLDPMKDECCGGCDTVKPVKEVVGLRMLVPGLSVMDSIGTKGIVESRQNMSLRVNVHGDNCNAICYTEMHAMDIVSVSRNKEWLPFRL